MRKKIEMELLNSEELGNITGGIVGTVSSPSYASVSTVSAIKPGDIVFKKCFVVVDIVIKACYTFEMKCPSGFAQTNDGMVCPKDFSLKQL